MQNKILLIVTDPIDEIGGIQKYNRYLLKIINNNYLNIKVDVVIIDNSLTETSINSNSNNVEYFIPTSIKTKSKLFTYIKAYKHQLDYVKKIINNNSYNLIIDSTNLYFKDISNWNNYYWIQHNNYSFYSSYIKKNLKNIFIKIIKFLIGYRNKFKKVKNIIVFDEINKNFFIKKNISKKDANLIPINLPEQKPPYIENVTKEIYSSRQKIIFVGRIDEHHKNISLLIKINEKLNIIDFYGDASPKNEINTKYKDILINKGWYKGVLKQKDLQKVINKYKFMILLSNTEGFPFSVVEGMSCGVPTIVNKCSLSLEYLNNKNSELVLDNENITLDEMILKIQKLLQMNSEKYCNISNNLLNFFKKNLIFDVFEQKWLNIFKKHLS